MINKQILINYRENIHIRKALSRSVTFKIDIPYFPDPVHKKFSSSKNFKESVSPSTYT